MKMCFKHNNKDISYVLKCTKRKTLCISIKPPGEVYVTAPINMSNNEVLESVKDKADWIDKKLYEVIEKESLRPDRKFIDGEKLMFLGRDYPLRLCEDNNALKEEVSFKDNEVIVTINSYNRDTVKNALEQWYRIKTHQFVSHCVTNNLYHFNVKPNRIKVKQQKKRWGSCSSKKNLNFNWRLSMAPRNVINYIVIHEMSHLEHLNHSSKFWNKVGSIMPCYKECKIWLDKYGAKLNL